MTIDVLEQTINALNLANGNSRRSDYTKAYKSFIEVLQGSNNGDKSRLMDILATFSQKLRDANLIQFAAMEESANNLLAALTSESVGKLIDAIRDRNVALPKLLEKLNVEIEKGNADAALLTKIKEAIEKGTKTLDELKTLVDALTATDADTESRIRALIAAARNISSTFMPA